MQERIAEIRKRNTGALPAWLNAEPRNLGWYCASWHTDRGVAPDDAARPGVLVLKWLARRGLLTSHGADALRAAMSNPAGFELTRLMVTPKGAAFLDRVFEQWWSIAGINVAMGPESEPSAVEALDQFWSDFSRATGPLYTAMADPQQVIDESRPMVEEFLRDIGICQPGHPIADVRLRDRFSDWIDAQEIRKEDVGYVAARVAAFICEYLIEGHSAVRYIDGNRILLRMPIDASQGVYRDFDPYAVAVGLLRDRRSLKEFLRILCG